MNGDTPGNNGPMNGGKGQHQSDEQVGVLVTSKRGSTVLH
jgi:hypothetical protein